MAAGDLVYGTPTVLPNISRLHSDLNNVATAFGEIDNSAVLAENYHIHLKIPIAPTATAGTYDIYMVESQDGVAWTDGIDPATDADYANYVKDAKLIAQASTVYNNTPAGARTNVELHFSVADYVSEPFNFIGFVNVNKSGQTIPAAGADGDYQSIKRATA